MLRQEVARGYAFAMRPAVPILAILLLVGCGGGDADERMRIADTRLVLPVIPGRPGALYFTLHAGDKPVTLTAIEAGGIGRVELHRTVREGTASRMVAIGGPVAARGAPLRFAPGSMHAMLIDVDPGIGPGDAVPLTFRIEPGAPIEYETRAQAAGSEGHEGH